MDPGAAMGKSESAPDNPMVPAFDQARVTVVPGEGVLARYPGILAVFRTTDPATGAEQLQRFLAICEEVSATGSRSPGRRLARQLGLWLGGLDEQVCLATVAATEGGLSVFLSGSTSVHVEGVSSALSGADSAAWLDRVIDWPTAPFALTVAGGAPSFEDSVFALKSGVVPGSGAVLVPPAMDGPSPVAAAGESLGASDLAPAAELQPEPTLPATAPRHAVPSPAPSDAAPAVPVLSLQQRPALVPPSRSSRLDDPAVAVPERPPLPVHPAAGGDSRGSTSGEPPQVQGFVCSRGHLNDPRALFCGLCGIRMAERTGVLTIGRRPPLGLLVFDDGVTFTVDAGYLLGREPESDERVRNGVIRPLMVIDNRGAVSRRHAELSLDGWNVLLCDIGSANGTFVCARGSDEWSALIPNRPVALLSGTRIRMGGRVMVFESPHGGA